MTAFRPGRLFACISLPGFLVMGGAPARSVAAAPPEVINAGHGGDNTADLLARLDRDVLARAPGLVILLAGTNDLLNSKKAVSLEGYRENLRALVQRIRAREARVLLLTMPPAHAPYLLKRHPAEFYGPAGPTARLAAGNAVIREVARENQVPVADLSKAFADAGGASELPASLIRNEANSGSADGVHPTAAGYRLMARLVAEVIAREKLADTRRVVCFGDSLTFGVHMTGEGTATGETYPALLWQALRDQSEKP